MIVGGPLMKTICPIALISLLVVIGCTRKRNDPADVKAIERSSADWDDAWNAGDIDALLAFYTSDAVLMGPNEPAVTGREAMRARFRSYFDIYDDETKSSLEDVRVSGDLAVVRGIYTDVSRPRTGGAPASEKGKWIGAYQRQPDGSWRIFWEMTSSDLPAVDAGPTGKDELALLQIEQEWADAVISRNTTALDHILAAEFVAHDSNGARNRKQTIDSVRNPSAKVESGDLSDMKVVVFGDTAVVHGLWTKKSAAGGRDSISRNRWTDTFVKRAGRWQCVGSYSTKAE
jgi:uncharacterized protein (TIGR02246 family)